MKKNKKTYLTPETVLQSLEAEGIMQGDIVFSASAGNRYQDPDGSNGNFGAPYRFM